MRTSAYAITAVLLLLATVGCDTTTGPGTGQGQDGLAVVSLAIAGTTGGRSVLPAQAELQDVSAWRLLGGKTGETRKPLTALFSDPNNQTLLLATGDWDFTLEGYADEFGETLILRETIRGRRITLEGPNTLSFVVEPVAEGTGSIEIAIELPAGHGITRVDVFKDGEKLELESPLMPDTQNNIVFEQADHEAGDYYYSFRLFKGDDLYGVVSELVQVRLNLSSKAAPKLGEEDLNLSYVIEYHLDVDAPDPDYYRRTDAVPALAKPDDRKGYEFDGWHTNVDLKDEPVTKLPTPVTGGNRDFYAEWIAKEYTITYKPDDQGINYGANPPAYTIEDGDITLEKPPKRTGFRFGGWYRDAELGEPIIETPTIPGGSTGDRTFYAEWIAQYTIVFETHGGSEVLPITEDMGTPVPWPDNPTWGTSQFNGWFNETGDLKYEWSYTPTGDLTMHAQWNHPVLFHPNGGSSTGGSAALAPQSVLDGDPVAEPPGMTRSAEGLYLCAFEDIEDFTVTFGGWYDNPGFQNDPWDFSDSVTRPLDLYANWVWSKSPVDIAGQTGNNTIEKALNYINGHAADNYTIVLEENFSMAGSTTQNITNANAVITLVGKGPGPTEISLTSNAMLFYISAGKLVLDKNITLKGVKTNFWSVVALQGVNAFLTMKDGAVITGNSTLGNNAGGVVVLSGSTFTMEGGTISGNSALNGGGVRVGSGSSFFMTGGTISGNSVSSDYGNGSGGGVYVSIDGTFTKTEGFIGGDNDITPYPSNGNATDNTAKGGNTYGHAVYYSKSSSERYYRDKTLENGDNISTENLTNNWNQ